MDFIEIRDKETLIDESFLSKLDKNFIQHLNAINTTQSGLVKEGLELSLLSEENKIHITKGKAILLNGKTYELKKDLSFSLPNLPSEPIENNSLIYLKDDDKNNFGIYFLEDSLSEDSEAYSLFRGKDDKQKDSLVIGYIENGVIYPTNRASQISSLPINGIGLYRGNDFKDLVTLKGCKVFKDALGRFLRITNISRNIFSIKEFSDARDKIIEYLNSKEDSKESEITFSLSNLPNSYLTEIFLLYLRKLEKGEYSTKHPEFYYEIGGSNSILLSKDHIPSLTMRGYTEDDGEHIHKILDRGKMATGDNYCGNVGTHNWIKKKDRDTTENGEHVHNIYIVHTNPSQKALSIEPSYTTFLPIIRVF